MNETVKKEKKNKVYRLNKRRSIYLTLGPGAQKTFRLSSRTPLHRCFLTSCPV